MRRSQGIVGDMVIDQFSPDIIAPEASRLELVTFVANGQRDRPAQWAFVERLKYYCTSVRRAELAELARAEFAMSR